MLENNLVNTFWRHVSRSVDASNHNTARAYQEKAVQAFYDVIHFCEAFDPDYKAGPADLALEFAMVMVNGAGQSFDIQETLPTDLYDRGKYIAEMSARAYSN